MALAIPAIKASADTTAAFIFKVRLATSLWNHCVKANDHRGLSEKDFGRK
jgi:hypothetical protein